MSDKTEKIIADELKHPDKYKPIAQGPWLALALVLLLGSLVPFWCGYQWLRTRLSKSSI